MDRYARPSAHVLEQLKTIVGTEYVTNSKPILASYVSKGIMGLECTVADAVVRPRTVEEVREVLRVARKHKIPVTPSSGGLSGGFACPLTEPGGILLDLSRMDRILEVDADCRYMVVEPGVTSGAAWSYFRSNCPDLAPPVPDGAPPAATLLGDAIERGFNLATNKYGPQADLVLGMEVVLSTGQVVRTGSLALQGAKPFYKWGIGPDLGGLFLGAQGTMGIVTKLAIKVLRHPKHKDLIAYGFGTVEDMVRATFVVLKREICVLVHRPRPGRPVSRRTRNHGDCDKIGHQSPPPSETQGPHRLRIWYGGGYGSSHICCTQEGNMRACSMWKLVAGPDKNGPRGGSVLRERLLEEDRCSRVVLEF